MVCVSSSLPTSARITLLSSLPSPPFQTTRRSHGDLSSLISLLLVNGCTCRCLSHAYGSNSLFDSSLFHSGKMIFAWISAFMDTAGHKEAGRTGTEGLHGASPRWSPPRLAAGQTLIFFELWSCLETCTRKVCVAGKESSAGYILLYNCVCKEQV